jgi:diguanylate cyclase (GGDEF)-like protein
LIFLKGIMPFLSDRQFKRIQDRQKLQTQELLMYQRVMEGMRTGLKMDALLKLIVDSVRKGLGFKRAGVFLVDPDGKQIRLALGIDAHGRYERNKSWFPITPNRGESRFSDLVNGYAKFFLTNNLPKRVPDKHFERELKVLNNAGVPIQVGEGQVIGTIFVDNLFVNRPITRADISALTNYATQVGLALQSLKTYEKLVHQSLTDPLTGLHNRRYFENTLDQELKRCQRYGRAFSLLIADIDRFKRVNDAFGHDSGDEVLKQVGGLIRDSLRSMDMVTRIGGEEFGILLPETPPNSISMVTHRLLKNIREAKPPVAEMVLSGCRTTISLGVSSFRKGNQATPESIFKLADKSLYLAKTRGRNRCGPVQIVTS